uniref:Ribosomal protein eL8/eL30/eS12/Gadd45 domain-containing protein n=1 Tax=Noctiluca scintillans TaxID=2966 RepID=A0A7S1F5S1_NOCSC|mmetsp:Transcript_34330/g.91799  ORF Transcript_34330/g.91799 Transcript_34330/m.91799 type:complete len:343 (+) Transcript_34330:92-1120(+)
MMDKGRIDVKTAVGQVSELAKETRMDMTGFRMGKQRLVPKKKKPSALKLVILAGREEKKEPEAGTDTGEKHSTSSYSVLSPNAPAFVPDFLRPALPVPTNEFVPSWCRDAEGSAPSEAQEVAARSEEEPEELPVAEALERIKVSAEQRSRKQKPKERGANIEVRAYVHQVLSDELDEKVKTILTDMVRFQERARENPLKFAKLKRYCVGIREATRAVYRGKAKGLFCAPNLELSSAEGGLDTCIEGLIEGCRENDVPVIFALSRNRIGKALGKNMRLSVVCLLNTEGAHKEFKDAVKLAEDLRRQWVLRQMDQMVLGESADLEPTQEADLDGTAEEADEELE